MTNIKTRGFKDPAELREHLAELDDEAPADDPPPKEENEFQLAIEQLQRDVDELSQRVDAASVRRRRPLPRNTTYGFGYSPLLPLPSFWGGSSAVYGLELPEPSPCRLWQQRSAIVSSTRFLTSQDISNGVAARIA
ncbi:hypothetical protein [Rhizobium sp. RM]|uniref:hypothetical protein n=1 Tax=Rhizobium sp. RM TaxID=2748079 RepID=UPI00110F4518|nr:hypothetical protein [Rhizobium sp. RM]NWJ27539.1 hypothetical protein [Rhizobium sp. RM]TMV20000.1 hypothetical protein BJG94_11450 [Rhizobium sp. Td3]